jgi:hypothetical protein
MHWEETKYLSDFYHVDLESGIHVVDIKWSDFEQEGWGPQSINILMEKTDSILLTLSNPEEEEISGTLHLSTLGWSGECGKTY